MHNRSNVCNGNVAAIFCQTFFRITRKFTVATRDGAGTHLFCSFLQNYIYCDIFSQRHTNFYFSLCNIYNKKDNYIQEILENFGFVFVSLLHGLIAGYLLKNTIQYFAGRMSVGTADP